MTTFSRSVSWIPNIHRHTPQRPPRSRPPRVALHFRPGSPQAPLPGGAFSAERPGPPRPLPVGNGPPAITPPGSKRALRPCGGGTRARRSRHLPTRLEPRPLCWQSFRLAQSACASRRRAHARCSLVKPGRRGRPLPGRGTPPRGLAGGAHARGGAGCPVPAGAERRRGQARPGSGGGHTMRAW